MTDRDLEIFMCVAKYGKMSDAAKQLYISQSSVSQAIASIEREYNILLFERLSKSLYLTEQGKKLLSHARILFSVKNDLNDFLTGAPHRHLLKVGATVTVATCVLSPIITGVRKQLSDVKINVNVANSFILEEMIMKNEVNLAMIENKVSNPNIICIDMMDDELVMVCGRGHQFFGREQVTAEELASVELILRKTGNETRTLFEKQMSELQLPLNVSWSCDNSEPIRSAVVNNQGVSVISKRLVADEVKRGILWTCPVSGLNLKRQFSVIYHKNKYITDEMTAFIRSCQNVARKESQFDL